jgi:hypothetical protein
VRLEPDETRRECRHRDCVRRKACVRLTNVSNTKASVAVSAAVLGFVAFFLNMPIFLGGLAITVGVEGSDAHSLCLLEVPLVA